MRNETIQPDVQNSIQKFGKSNTFSENVNFNRFCNNCGRRGHLYNTCTYPITSIGIIGYRLNTDKNKHEYLIIRRKHSLGYMDFIRGKYNVYNKLHIMNLINEMTNIEKNAILKLDFTTLWNHIWDNKKIYKYKNEQNLSMDKLEKLRSGIELNNETYSLESCILESSTSWTEPEWGFPKGRREFKETDLDTALREFTEETGYSKEDCNIIENIIPFEENFIGSNYKAYKHKYYLANITNTEINTNNFESIEVSKVEWHIKEECAYRIRNYNKKRIEFIYNIDDILEKYTIL
jgi:8-oxo-dGTP pyrophosphatase MutT (NUDIX family)